jgi:hypothetical protein
MTMTVKEQLTEARQMWTALIPFCPLPTDNTLIRWVARFNTEELMVGFSITAGKFEKERTADADRMYRYCTSVMHNRQIDAQRAGAAR